MSQTFIEPKFLLPYSLSSPVEDYRSAVNADGTAVIFERWTNPTRGVENPPFVLYQLALSRNEPPTPFLSGSPRVNVSTRPDSSWVTGQVVFSNGRGVWLVGADGVDPALIGGTADMIYPAWFPMPPPYQALAVYNEQTSASPLPNTTEIDVEGNLIATALAGPGLYAGMPSVNPVDPTLIAFAGQSVANGSYDQDANYIWLVDTSKDPVTPVPLETGAPISGPFQKQWQGRAPWWSPDGKWVAFESNRAHPPAPGQTSGGLYAIFLYQVGGTTAAVQLTDPKWNMNHAKWFPNGFSIAGDKALIVAAFQQLDPSQPPAWPYGLATLDVSSVIGPGET